MKRLVVCLLAALVLLSSCERRARVIPVNKFTRIYAEMYLADQWVKANPSFRKTADTTLFYESIFKHYGYDRKDYYGSVDYYMDHPETFVKIVEGAMSILDAGRSEAERLMSEMEKLARRRDSLDAVADSTEYAELAGYIDSLYVADSLQLWALLDSLGISD